jgi:SAM-dependent methyltransferase
MAIDADRRWVGSMPEAYERHLAGPVFRPFAVDLARRAAATAPARVLELAAGTGVLTEALLTAAPQAQVVATDLNEAMVRFGAQRAPRASWREADATALPFGDGEFDLVTCQFGVMFFPDKPAAFAQARRVLAPGGRLLFNTWDTVEKHGYATALMAAVRAAFPQGPPTFITAVPHAYHDTEAVTRDLRAGGFDEIAVETVELTGPATTAEQIAVGFCTGTPLRATIEARGDLASSTATVAREMTAVLGDGPVACTMRAYVVTALAPS